MIASNDDAATQPDSGQANIAHLTMLASTSERFGLIWSGISEDLNVNLILLVDGKGVEEHVNAELDVLVICLFGQGSITIDGLERPFGAGDVVILEKRSVRAFRAGPGRFAYLTCHRRRGGIWPAVTGKDPD
ncbi:MAG: cupin domain-containing protein [Thermomicrobiales bacterium]